MRALRLKLQGFTSFKEPVEISFMGLDRFVICGPTGAGKSSLLDAITFALFADAPRIGAGNIKDLISLGRKSLRVEFEFRIDQHDYRVVRVRRQAGATDDQLQVLSDDKWLVERTGSKEVDKRVVELLGLNLSHFTQAVFLPQGQFAEFLKSKPSERRKLLRELLRLNVYERMREVASREHSQAEALREDRQRRLDSAELQTTTPEAVAELEKRAEQAATLAAELATRVPDLQQQLEVRRQNRDRTVEMEQKENKLSLLKAREQEIVRAREKLEAGRRAASAAPACEQFEALEAERQKRSESRSRAAKALSQSETEWGAAAAHLQEAESAAEAVPGLRAKLDRLSIAMARAMDRDALRARLDQARQGRAKVAEQTKAHAGALQKCGDELRRLGEQAATGRQRLEALQFDPQLLERLEAEQGRAMELRNLRSGLRAEQKRQQELEVRLGDLAEKLKAAEKVGRERVNERDAAEHEVIEARERWQREQEAHQAAHLRQNLRVSEPCPVCLQQVSELPENVPPSLLAQAKATLEKAEAEFKATSQHALAATQEEAAARMHWAEARKVLESLGETVRDLSANIRALDAELSMVLGVAANGKPFEEVLLESLKSLKAKEAQYVAAERDVAKAERELELKRKDWDRLDADGKRLDESAAEAEHRAAELEAALSKLDAEIRAAAGSDRPAVENERLKKQIEDLEKSRKEAAKREADRANRLALAKKELQLHAEELAELDVRHDRARTAMLKALREADIADPAAVRAALLTQAESERLSEAVQSFTTEYHILGHRISELNRLLRGHWTTEAEFVATQADLDKCLTARNEAERELHHIETRRQLLKDRVAEAETLRKEIADLQARHATYKRLADDLKGDSFQSYLLSETLDGLIRDAALHLLRLTNGRYGLEYRDEQILVVDHDNAGETRLADTLSGGETFLASLSLALAMSDQVQRAAGAVKLDCLFIDEGFGTLDPETLRTVSDSIHGLQAGGRMVGIVTHVEELKEEFTERIMVRKVDGTSTVEIETFAA